ncbi:TPA: TraK family protein [Legionella pneumophila]|uniref:TraK family protein n=1 Tax=Legionella pneumophila TaxID=446 RepID=UPI00038FB4DD|nr:TraK family protein [Legionella pneumophila]ERH42064.1 conjugal transfer protein TraK [Legionella pneumophila str. Leg01/53]ERH46599.1 conjugal transfer protein TraK [Legionella pneumophila str. Leg01/11]ERI48690.1 conjugal transfer protein TraK [Legionella pneumophila str. Leg01/20]ERB39919.1 conjugal transfer protein TraK [Legionella pneumophila str. 121004]MCW8472421.1 TraK family protein [Legionella pneumophila]
MKKSLIENITTSKQSPQRTNARKSKVEFLAMREDISEALEKGWLVTIIWETLSEEGSFTATYNMFRSYVLKYLSGQKSGYSPKESVAVRTMKSVENQSSKKKDISKPSFSYNPINNIKGLL